MKTSRFGLFSVGRFLITNSGYLPVIGLFKFFYFFSWISSDNLCPSRNLSISSKLFNLFTTYCNIVNNIYHMSLYSFNFFRVCSDVPFCIVDFGNLFYFLFFPMVNPVKVLSVLLLIPRTNFWFHWFSLLFSVFYFIDFCSSLYFFSSACLGLLSFLFETFLLF